MEFKELIILYVSLPVFIFIIFMIFLCVSDFRRCCTKSGPILLSFLPKLFLFGFKERKRVKTGELRYYIFGKLVHQYIPFWWHVIFLLIVNWAFTVFWTTFLLEESTICNPDPEWNCFIDGSFVRTNSCVVEEDPIIPGQVAYEKPTTAGVYCFHIALNVPKGLLYTVFFIVVMLAVVNLLNRIFIRIVHVQRTTVKRVLTFCLFFCMLLFLLGCVVLSYSTVFSIFRGRHFNRILPTLPLFIHMFYCLMTIQGFYYQVMFALAVKSKMYINEDEDSDYSKEFEEIEESYDMTKRPKLKCLLNL